MSRFVANPGEMSLVHRKKPVKHLQGQHDQQSHGRGGGRLDVTNTPEFKKWFGSSKVVDKNGEPAVQYHGSPVAGFTEFDVSEQREIAILGKGFYFTDNESEADSYQYGSEVGETKAVYLKIERPFDVNQPLEQEARDAIRKQAEIFSGNESQGIGKPGPPLALDQPYTGGNSLDKYRNRNRAKLDELLRDPKSNGGDILRQLDKTWGDYTAANIIKDSNFDGVRVKNKSGSTWHTVFDSRQVKATTNEGTFDPSNPNIYKSNDEITIRAS